MSNPNEQIFAPKRHDHLLVIPVINEGDRIRRQLERIAAAAPEIDIVIADGGSTDGSLEGEALASLGVRALLTKTGPGRLSAQLRMAYDWGMAQGYAGIVTMDGNDKDGAEAIARFVDMLRQGYDYVQGSRYVEGGAGINTPLDRKIAGRLIHAPLLSFGAHRRLSDTTNGFRAYSRRYLSDPRCAPFRPLFRNYNLLFYLSVRAGALGYRVGQLPVTRAYPAGEKTPTKIAGLRSRFELLSETFNAATGAYSPPSGPAQHLFPSTRRTALFLFLLVAALIAAFALIFAPRMALSPDSWTQFELAHSLPGDFYRVHVRRGFWSEPTYSAAFPPLWPAIILLTDLVAGLGARSGYYAAWFAAGLFVAASEWTGRRFFSARWIGGAAALLLLSHPGLLEEVLGGRTIPFQLLLYAICGALLAGGAPIRAGRAAAIGLVAGLALTNRFDALPFSLALGLVLAFLTRAWRPILAYAGAFLVAASPWIYYSRVHFGRWFVTDNAATALAVDPRAFVTDWWPRPPLGAGDAPLAWLAKVATNGAKLPFAFLDSFAGQALWILPLILAWAFVRFAGLSLEAEGGKGSEVRPRRDPRLIGFALALCAILPSYALTGYFDARYFAPQIWLAILLFFGWLTRQLANREQADLFGLLCLALAFATTGVALTTTARAMPKTISAEFPRDAEDAELARCLFAESSRPVLLSTDDAQASRLSAVYGWNTVLLPRNLPRLTPAEARQFVKQLAITHLYAPDPGQAEILAGKLPLAAAPNCPASVKGLQP